METTTAVVEATPTSEDGEKKKKKKKESTEIVTAIVDDSATTDETEKKKKKKKKKEAAAEPSDNGTSNVTDTDSTAQEKELDAAETTATGVPYAGQWGSASLGSDTRNEKFLRLMGGFKAGAKAKDPTKKKFASTALSGKREEQLLKGLESQFEHARETHLVNRGLGLGFAAEEKQNTGTGFNF